ncbi:tetratricopeptide repeat protein [Methanocella arvoryzae]|uniref:Tetratricopeptide repeat protein n=1 Tax=Methanocella arvoryzae (strain DSM 22066 / NBRC 105507 / MRE50) TaxID=351160 RepID=Q0W0K3_METAR|nr:tetratricopeptide repeat protein [Methanocella arvoryzae]CAJ38090.1 hypothetical protein RRC375 [Methanocella arvoryzae MRE50]
MAARKKLTRLARIGMSHRDKAKSLAAAGMYSEALSELRVALFSLRNENTDGRLNEDIAGVLHSIGMTNLLLNKYQDARTAFADAVAIRRPMTNNPEIAGSLIGLAEACRGMCEFEQAEDTLQEALHISLSQKNDALASRVISMLEMLERTKDELPAGETADSTSADYYTPRAYSGVHAILRNIELNIAPDKVTLGLVLGFPGVDSSLLSRNQDGAPGIGLFFPEKPGMVRSISVTDEEEEKVNAEAIPFKGNFFAPGSYHKNGPLPVPVCKKFTFTTGTGYILKWEITSNGWYRADMELDFKTVEEGFRFILALPFYLSLRNVTVNVKKPLEYRLLSIDEGTFHVTRNPDRVRPGNHLPYAFKRRLFNGSAFGLIDLQSDASLKYGIVSFDLSQE